MAVRNAFRSPHPAMRELAPGITHHIFLIAVRESAEKPLLHAGHPLQPMRAVLASAGELPPYAAPDNAVGPLPALPPPQWLMQATRATAAVLPREVTGEILRDGHGRLYERIGDRVRQVNRLFTGAHGEVVDLAPLDDDAPRDGNGEEPGGPPQEPSTERSPHEEPRSLRHLARPLLPDPGIWRLVRFADFVDALEPQLAEPRRLRPGHQLPCYAQVHEITGAASQATLDAAAARTLGHAGKLIPLSYDLCRRLALSLPRPAMGIAAQQAPSRGAVAAGSRFLTLRVAIDPTRDAAGGTGDAPPLAQAVSQPAPAVPKAVVPEAFAKPWDYRLSREEALYDMALAEHPGLSRRLLARFSRGVPRAALAKWQAMLDGKSPEEQLWGVRPPPGALRDARVRRHVERLLRAAGHDLQAMAEWEIHWRRRGL